MKLRLVLAWAIALPYKWTEYLVSLISLQTPRIQWAIILWNCTSFHLKTYLTKLHGLNLFPYNSVSETQETWCPCEASGPTCWPLIPEAHGNSSRSTTASVWCECISWSSFSWRSSLSEWSKLGSPNSSMTALWMNCTTAWKLPFCSEGRVVPFGWSFLCRMSRRKWQIRITDSLPGGSVEAQQPPVLKDTHDCWIGEMMPTRVGYIQQIIEHEKISWSKKFHP